MNELLEAPMTAAAGYDFGWSRTAYRAPWLAAAVLLGIALGPASARPAQVAGHSLCTVPTVVLHAECRA